MTVLHSTGRRTLLMAAALMPIPRLVRAADEADGFPSRPVRVILPFPAGSTGDAALRSVAQFLSGEWQQQVFVDNRPGANGTIGADAVAKAAPDGHTLGQVAMGALALSPHLMRLPYDPLRDLVPVSKFGAGPLVLLAGAKAPFDTVEQMVRHSRGQPGGLRVAGFGVGSIAHLAILKMAKALGTDLTHVPYQGGPQQVADTIGGQVPLLLDLPSVVTQHVRSGALKALACTGSERLPGLPQTPTFAELGYADLVITAWGGVVAPARTPGAIVRKISDGFVRGLARPEVQERVAAAGGEYKGSTPEAFAALWREEHDRWGRVIREGGVKLE